MIESLTEADAAALAFEWRFWARPSQVAPDGDWKTFLVLAGRGFGKTRCGAEWVREQAEQDPKARITLAGPTAADVRDVMITGESGILAISPPSFRPTYEPSKRRLAWPNGAQALLVSADEPDRFRGIQSTKAWCDELAAWRRPDAWDQLQFGLRLGSRPQVMVTTTPRPTALIKSLAKSPDTVIVRGSTYDNANNLAPAFIDQIRKKYENSRMGRQEIFAEILEERAGALWSTKLIQYRTVL